MSPQASDEMRARWPGWDTEALEYLERRGFTVTPEFVIRPPSSGCKLTEREGDAIDFLCDEFDYGWMP